MSMVTTLEMARELKTFLDDAQKISPNGKLSLKDYENAIQRLHQRAAEELNRGNSLRMGALGMLKPEKVGGRIVRSNLPNLQKVYRIPEEIRPILYPGRDLINYLNKDFKTLQLKK
jgi:nucleoid DNA-binding protein